jgi:sugar transferase (PEP-CTERM system associated)
MIKLFKQYYPIRNIFFVIGEGLLILFSVIIAAVIIWGDPIPQVNSLLAFKILLVTMVCQICLYYNDLYDFKIIKTYPELSIRLFQAIGMAAIILAGIYTIFPETIIGSMTFAISTCFIILLIGSWRFCYKLVLNRGIFNEKIILLGAGKMAMAIYAEIRDKEDCGYTVRVIAYDEKNRNDAIKGDDEVLTKQTFHGLCETAKEFEISKIIVAIEEKRGGFPTQELLACRVSGIDIIEGSTFYEMLTGKLIVEQIKPAWLIFSKGFEKSFVRRLFKRSVDLSLAILMAIISAPILGFVTILIKLDSRGPVIFSQDRMGQNRKNYKVYKFRSMVADAEKKTGPVWAGDDDSRITRVGKVIRKLRIDELPQIWNVIKGDMSFVGPRPEREFFVQKLEAAIPFYGERFNAKPGITGWAQVSYGYGASVEDAVEKLNYDLFYIKNMSIFMDIVIIIKTVKIVLFGKGAR